jgi:hypothetical protein
MSRNLIRQPPLDWLIIRSSRFTHVRVSGHLPCGQQVQQRPLENLLLDRDGASIRRADTQQ